MECRGKRENHHSQAGHAYDGRGNLRKQDDRTWRLAIHGLSTDFDPIDGSFFYGSLLTTQNYMDREQEAAQRTMDETHTHASFMAV